MWKLALVLSLLLAAHCGAQPVPTKRWSGASYIVLTKDSSLTWSLDTTEMKPFLQRIIDSSLSHDSSLSAILPMTVGSAGRIKRFGLHPDTAMAYRNSGAQMDTAKFVSIDRDDSSIRGEKTFAGEVSVVKRIGIGSTTMPSPDPTRLFILHDSASKRLGNTVAGITNVSSTNTFLVYESGIISEPLQSCVRAYRSGNVSLTAGLDTKIQFNAETRDSQYEFDSANNNDFVARCAGVYLICATAAVRASDTNYIYLTVYKGVAQHSIGGIFRSVWNGFNHYAAGMVTALVTLNAGETVHIRVLSNTSATLAGNSEETHTEIIKLL